MIPPYYFATEIHVLMTWFKICVTFLCKNYCESCFEDTGMISDLMYDKSNVLSEEYKLYMVIYMT